METKAQPQARVARTQSDGGLTVERGSQQRESAERDSDSGAEAHACAAAREAWSSFAGASSHSRMMAEIDHNTQRPLP